MMTKRILPIVLMIACVVFSAEATQDFSLAAERAIPAVVSIKTKINPRTTSFSQQEEFDDLFGPNDLFKHFFGPRFMPPQQQMPQMGQGSGFIITPDGYIVTNSHVVKDADEITVIFDEADEYSGKLIGFDANTDIALIKIEASNLPHLEMIDSELIRVGQPVAAIGTPLGLRATLTSGIISAKGRNNLDITRVEDFIQTDAAINRGNSGGPLVDLEGRVVGMNTAIVSPTGSNMGIGFAIPSNMIAHVIDQIRETGTVSRGFMGVVLQQVDKDLATAFDLKEAGGALVAELAPDSPAGDAGVKQGDILLQYDNTPIRNVGSLRNAVSMMQPGKTVTFTVLRDGKTVEIPVTIGEFPTDDPTTSTHETNLGIKVDPITPETARKLGHTQDYGVVVTGVDPGSLAAWAGIQKGAVIMEVNRKKIHSIDDFKKALKATGSGKPVLLLVKQGDSTRYVSLRG